MTKANQGIGFDLGNPIIRGTDQTVLATIEASAVSDWLAASAALYEWYFDDPTDAGSAQTPVLSVSLGSMTLAASGAEAFTATIPIADTDTAALDAQAFYHQLRMVSGSGLVGIAFTGFAKLTAEG